MPNGFLLPKVTSGRLIRPQENQLCMMNILEDPVVGLQKDYLLFASLATVAVWLGGMN